ncbi:hypothetical protein SRABI96_03373 [Peribacillus sp. Bi96]|uniref:hypothetical protein n=1 Tax=Peribacillus TaxID=2675229 RepID=UPI000AF02427|nr:MULTISPECIES: hypothetical protein [Peribacillus]CAH0259026.1 hypothetical protein SRABI96_03373 [Peribacillus sp. Bi96]
MKLFLNLVLGVVISVAIFFLLLTAFSEDVGPFFIITVLIGLVLGLQIYILSKIKNI